MWLDVEAGNRSNISVVFIILLFALVLSSEYVMAKLRV